MVAGKSGAKAGIPVDPKLEALRQQMAAADGGAGVDVYIIPSEDPHMSEYAPASQERRHYISGFTGSAGTALVTKDRALLWTDGRYYLQAEQQLGPAWELMKGDTPGVPDIPEWCTKLPAGARVGIDPFLHTVGNARKLQTTLERGGQKLVPLFGGNLVDAVWHDAPAAQAAPLRVHPIKFAGTSVKDKLKHIRSELKESNVDAVLITALDETAWLFNMRGSDVDYNPVFVSYGIVTAKDATLFVDPAKVTEAAAEHLKSSSVRVKPYGAVLDDVRAIAGAGKNLWVDPSQVSFAIAKAFADAAEERGTKRPREEEGAAPPPAPKAKAAGVLLEKKSPVSLPKAIKNEAELAGMREAHLRDAVAICDFLQWIEKEIAGGAVLKETDVDEQLTARRAAQEGFIELSFPTIAGANGNGAIIHYRAEESTCATVDATSQLLLDSGGQYDCGTTDITRTMHFGTPSDHQKRCFTAVLKGHIALDSVVFPHDTPGLSLDTLARGALWQLGLDYRHGTGHGVGAALNVHEGPHSISKRFHITQGMQAGMIVSNEPGYYEDGVFGIRIENLLIARQAETAFQFGGLPYLSFERLTLVPLQRKLMDVQALTPTEVAWVDGYHAEVWEKVHDRLLGAPLEWLRVNTAPLAV